MQHAPSRPIRSDRHLQAQARLSNTARAVQHDAGWAIIVTLTQPFPKNIWVGIGINRGRLVCELFGQKVSAKPRKRTNIFWMGNYAATAGPNPAISNAPQHVEPERQSSPV